MGLNRLFSRGKNKSAKEFYKKGLNAEKKENFEEALSFYGKATKIDIKCLDAWLNQAAIHIKLSKNMNHVLFHYKSAFKFLKMYIKYSGENDSQIAKINIILVFLTEEIDRLNELYDVVGPNGMITIDTEVSSLICFYRATWLYLLEKCKYASEEFEKLHEAGFKDIGKEYQKMALMYNAECLARLGKNDLSYKYCIESKSFLNDSDDYKKIGDIFSAINCLEDGLDCYNNAVQLNKTDFDVYFYKGVLELKLGNKLDALNSFKTTISGENSLPDEMIKVIKDLINTLESGQDLNYEAIDKVQVQFRG